MLGLVQRYAFPSSAVSDMLESNMETIYSTHFEKRKLEETKH
ncbi:LSU ribosomal protein L19E [Giardia duodenalis assemblage B]|uniref:LSU ribosomal protein L19E n=2 Tax=Giardia intestinalis TaxID=5741 RepID=A0A132NS22_GIAIN|nr:LSU ribosomal protein L19E [Giardia intestinalis]KWX12522.1 LSU ribosomal protein L19E [Giardia intestinalis assemblage B]